MIFLKQGFWFEGDSIGYEKLSQRLWKISLIKSIKQNECYLEKENGEPRWRKHRLDDICEKYLKVLKT